MIYTITLSPSLDYTMRLEKLCVGGINRVCDEALFPGGKGINVSVVLHNLAVETEMLGFTAGFTGEEIERLIKKNGCRCDFIKTKGMSRINVQLKAESETSINGRGPLIGEQEMEKLYEKLDKIQDGDFLVLAGSIPSCMHPDTYRQIIERYSHKKLMVTVDAENELLLNTLQFKPFLIKPNNFELAEMTGRELRSEVDIVFAARELQQRGAKNVLVSMGADGAILVTADDDVFKAEAPQGKMINSVGAGDSMVAGFLYGYIKEKSYKKALDWGIAAGSATAFTEWLARRDDIERLYAEIKKPQ